MAIKNLISRLAERGKIKIGEKGEKRKNEKGKEWLQPRKLDHFLITTTQKDEAGRLMLDKALMKKLAPEGAQILKNDAPRLTEIPIRLLYDDPDLNFQTSLFCWESGQEKKQGEGLHIFCTGDNEKAQRWNGRKYEEIACPCERILPGYQPRKGKCKYSGLLQCIIEGAETVGGVWTVRTKSRNSVENISSSLRFIWLATGGILSWLPLSLVVSPKSVIPPGESAPQTVYVLSVEFKGTWDELVEKGLARKKAMVEHKINMALLEDQTRRIYDTEGITQEELMEIRDEFFPDSAKDHYAKEGGDNDKAAEGPVIEAEVEEVKESPQKAGQPIDLPEGSADGNQGKSASNPLTPERLLVTDMSPSKAFKMLRDHAIRARIEPSGKIYYQEADEATVREIFPLDAKAEPQNEEKVHSNQDDALNPQGPEGGAEQVPEAESGAESTASITLPNMMELVKNPGDVPISLPISLTTKQGVRLGRWLDYGLGMDQEMQVTLELAEDLEKVAQGLTVSDLKKSFAEAGIRMVISNAGAVKEKEEDPVVALPTAAQEKVSLQSGSKGNDDRLLTLF